MFGYNSTGSEPIWMKVGEFWVHCLPLALADFGHNPCRSESETARRNFFCQVSNTRFHRLPISQISQNLHTRRGSESWWILLEQHFENFPVNDRFFFKKAIFFAKIFNDLRLQALITPWGYKFMKTHDQVGPLQDVDFPFLPLKSTESHSPGQQSPYKERHPSIQNHCQSRTSSY